MCTSLDICILTSGAFWQLQASERYYKISEFGVKVQILIFYETRGAVYQNTHTNVYFNPMLSYFMFIHL